MGSSRFSLIRLVPNGLGEIPNEIQVWPESNETILVPSRGTRLEKRLSIIETRRALLQPMNRNIKLKKLKTYITVVVLN